MAARSSTTNDLFLTTLHDLHTRAPIELLESLRSQLEHIRLTNPNCAQTAKACLEGLSSDQSTLLHVLTAAYLVNGGVMIKHQAALGDEEGEDLDPETKDTKLNTEIASSITEKSSCKEDLSKEFDSLEEELKRFSITLNGDLKKGIEPESGSEHRP